MKHIDRRDFLKATGTLALGSTLPFRVAQAAGETLTVGFIYPGPRNDSGWNEGHAQAAATIRKMPGVKLIEEENVPETVAVQQAMEGMIRQDGAKLIFATSYGYLDPHVLKVAEKYPEVRFVWAGTWSPGKRPPNVGSVWAYSDQPAFLNGVVAAMMSKTKKVGWVGAKPVPQVLIDINSFTLGAQSVDPTITTHLIMTGDWWLPIKEAEATISLMDQGCDVLTCDSQSPRTVVETAEKRGAMTIGNHINMAGLAPKGFLTGSEWGWAVPYAAHVKAVQQGKPMVNVMRGNLKDGFIRNSPFGPSVSAAAKAKAAEIKARMLAGKFPIYKGPLKDNKGAIVIPAGVVQQEDDVALESMNYLVAGVVGQS
jgi:simple sugar transport system substrate-binding protein